MFVVDAAVLLPHPPRAVARVTGSLALLPRWCAGLRRVRFPATAPAAGCVLTYAAADVRLTLQARTLAGRELEALGHPAAGAVIHTAEGDGLTLRWTLSLEVPDDRQTRLRACVEVMVDPGHPLAAVRAALCRTVARRVPADLERLRVLVDRYERGRSSGPRSASDLAAPDVEERDVEERDVAPVRAQG